MDGNINYVYTVLCLLHYIYGHSVAQEKSKTILANALARQNDAFFSDSDSDESEETGYPNTALSLSKIKEKLKDGLQSDTQLLPDGSSVDTMAVEGSSAYIRSAVRGTVPKKKKSGASAKVSSAKARASKPAAATNLKSASKKASKPPPKSLKLDSIKSFDNMKIPRKENPAPNQKSSLPQSAAIISAAKAKLQKNKITLPVVKNKTLASTQPLTKLVSKSSKEEMKIETTTISSGLSGGSVGDLKATLSEKNEATVAGILTTTEQPLPKQESATGSGRVEETTLVYMTTENPTFNTSELPPVKFVKNETVETTIPPLQTTTETTQLPLVIVSTTETFVQSTKTYPTSSELLLQDTNEIYGYSKEPRNLPDLEYQVTDPTLSTMEASLDAMRPKIVRTNTKLGLSRGKDRKFSKARTSMFKK